MASNTYTNEECVEALRLIAEHGSVAAANRASSIPISTLKNRRDEGKIRGLTTDTKVLDRAGRLAIELAAARRDIRALTKEADSAERIRVEIYNLAARTPEPPTWISKPSGPAKSLGVPVTIWSDWHYGEVVRREEVGGVNEFNAEIAAARITKLVDSTIDLCRNHMGTGNAKYPGIVVMLGGDMLSGDIHEELFATNDRTTQQCINDLTDLLAGALERIADEFGRVFVPCVVGNHGRASRKPRMKGRVFTSHEWNVYCSLERYFKRDKRVQFLIPDETDAHFNINGTRFMLTHGDSLGVKGGDGIIGAIGPIMRGTIKVRNSEMQIGKDIDYVVMGHWHQTLWLPGVIVNNCLKGYDEYARLALRAPYAPASQSLWFVHPKHGVTARWEVKLQEGAHADATKAKAWVSWEEDQ